MKNTKRHNISRNRFCSQRLMFVSILFISIFVITPCEALFAQSDNNGTEKNDTIPPDKNRYIYLKKRMQLDFDVLLQPQQQTYFGPLLQINSNENDYYNLFLDYRKGEYNNSSFTPREPTQIANSPVQTDGNEQEINIKLTLFQQRTNLPYRSVTRCTRSTTSDSNPKPGTNSPSWRIRKRCSIPAGNQPCKSATFILSKRPINTYPKVSGTGFYLY